MRPQAEAGGGKLMGLLSDTGQTMWELAVPVAAASVYGDVLLAAIEPHGQPARAVAYRLP